MNTPFTYIQIWLSQRSEVTLLRGYGPNVPVELIERLCRAFAELRAMNDAGAIAYPYSTRELVNVVVHVQAYVHIASQHFASHDNASSVPLVAGSGQPQRQRRPPFLGHALAGLGQTKAALASLGVWPSIHDLVFMHTCIFDRLRTPRMVSLLCL
jgi:hypothetical protein